MKAVQLKNSILQLAVQGKLVNQDPADEPASVLLERIRAEKQRLVKEGKIKKDKNESVIYRVPKEDGDGADNLPYAFYEQTTDGTVRDITDELPFEIPDSWEWVRLGELVEVITSGSRDWAKYYSARGAKFVRMGNLSRNSFELRDASYQYVSLPEQAEGTRTSLMEDDLLFSITGDVGMMGLIPSGFGEAYINQHTAMIRFTAVMRGKYLPFVLLSDYAQKYYKKTQHGIKNSFRLDTISFIPIPLPPFAEQHRIVERIAESLPHITDYDVAEQQLSALNAAFPDALKKSILQAAVQGKLVSQDSADEPASALLDRIRAEKDALVKSGKVKRNKHESVIFRRDNSYYEMVDGIECCIDDEIPFDIPGNWEWARLGALCNYGECENAESRDIAPEAWLLDLEDIEKDSGRLIQRKQKRDVASSSSKHRFEAREVLYSKLRPYLNKVIIADEDGYCTSEILPLDFGDWVYNRYAQAYLMCPFFVEYANQCSYGVKMPRLGTQDGRNAVVPLPPLAEQRRIVARIDDLMPLCNSL